MKNSAKIYKYSFGFDFVITATGYGFMFAYVIFKITQFFYRVKELKELITYLIIFKKVLDYFIFYSFILFQIFFK